jgi:hypothetical protein
MKTPENTSTLTVKELQSVQNLESKIFKGELKTDLALKYLSVLSDFNILMTVAEYARTQNVSYNTAKNRVVVNIGGVDFCCLDDQPEHESDWNQY